MEDEDGTVPPLRSRRRRAAIALAPLLVAALALLWVERRTIASRFIDRQLAAAGVPARYVVTDLGPGRQRLERVVIGDPAAPDLVADWIETRVGYGLGGARLEGVAAGRLRLRARLVDGRVRLGTIDRLLPPPSGAPFALPALSVDLADARIRLETPTGLVGLRVAGRGRLDDGFVGTVAAVAPALAAQGCAVGRSSAAMRVRTVPRGLRLSGPLRVAAGRCAGATLAALRADMRADIALAGASGSAVEARIATGPLVHSAGRSDAVAGTIALTQVAPGALAGRIDLAAARPRGLGLAARELALAGRIARDGTTGLGFDGRVALADTDLASRLPDLRGVAAGSPVAPLVDRIALALARGARRMSIAADVRAALAATPAIDIAQARVTTHSGAVLTVTPATDAPALRWHDGTPAIDATLALAGGDLPGVRAAIRRDPRTGALAGTATLSPYAAGDASLALTPVRFAIGRAGSVLSTRAMLSGPIGGGRVEALSLPIDLRRDAAGRIALNRACTPLGWRSLRISGLVLDPARLTLCPEAGALVRIDGGRVAGAARIGATSLTGRIGGTALRVAAAGGRGALTNRGFALNGVEAYLGSPPRATRIAFGTLTGRIGGGVTGSFADGGGQVANVPLILSAAAGEWRLAGGVLSLGGAMTVTDQQAAAPRFRPMAARDVRFVLADNAIAVTGRLAEPTTGTHVADLRIDHALRNGQGLATIAMPGIDFREGFQPDLLTRLTFGVVADVRGRMAGDARIAWGPDGVTSTGRFGTQAMNLAAAFGPVTGLATTLNFTDLLAMRTASGQIATVATVNPGIPVEDGTIRYALEGPTLIRVDGGRWPFAGGALTLDPTRLDFSGNEDRRLTFHVEGADARAFLQQFDFDNIDATGVFDGSLPMVFGEAGGRIDDGHLTMREGGGTIAYVGQLGQEQLGLWGDIAFQALRSLRYRSLAVTLNGPLAGEMVTDVRFAGISQGRGARSNFIVRRLQRLPFVFNIRIRAPFRGLLDSAQSFYDPRRLIQRNLPALLEEQNKRAAPPVVPPATPPAVQPPSSENQR